MSRGGRGRGGGGRGGFGGSNMPPMGLSFADVANMSREPTELYPSMDPLPVLSSYTDEERYISELQDAFTTRMRQSAYYVVERTRADELPRYSDKYRPSQATQPTLKKSDLHQPFFPPEIFQDYFNPKRKKKALKRSAKKAKLDAIDGEDDADDKSSEAGSEIGSQEAASDYDVDEEYDNDYAENYFDNGEGDDNDDLGGGGGGGDEGGGGDYD